MTYISEFKLETFCCSTTGCAFTLVVVEVDATVDVVSSLDLAAAFSS